MGEIADELERWAEVFHGRAREHFARQENNVGGALMAVVDSMQQRAAELRAQRSEPAYEPQSKPDAVRARQWWALICSDGDIDGPGRVQWLDAYHAYMRTESGQRWDAPSAWMLRHPRWLYLGDGPLPAR